jgi:hypothetical protein
VKVGAVTLVTLSVCDAPLSDASVRSGAGGLIGGVASRTCTVACAVLLSTSLSERTTVMSRSAVFGETLEFANRTWLSAV